MKRIGSALRARPLVVGIVATIVGMVLLVVPPLLDGIAGECVHELVIAALMLATMALVGGAATVRPSARGMGFALRAAVPLLVIAAFPLVMTLVALAAMPEALGLGPLSFDALAPALPAFFLASVALALAVALLEEALFRGLLLNAAVERFGGTSDGLLGASVAASLVFGAVHVLPGLAGGSLDASTVVQALCRVLVSGAIGLLLAAVYLRTHNLWCAVLVHALNDLLELVPAFLLAAGAMASGGAEAMASDAAGSSALSLVGAEGVLASGGAADGMLLVGSILLTAFYVPVVATAVRRLRRVDPSEGTIFSATWHARAVPRDRRGDAAKDRPVPPAARG